MGYIHKHTYMHRILIVVIPSSTLLNILVDDYYIDSLSLSLSVSLSFFFPYVSHLNHLTICILLIVVLGLLTERERYEGPVKALQAATKLLQLYRDSPIALEERARLLQLNGNLSQSFLTAKKASKVSSQSNAGFRLVLLQSLVAEQLDDPTRASKVLRKLLKLVESHGSEQLLHIRKQYLDAITLPVIFTSINNPSTHISLCLSLSCSVFVLE